MSQIKLTQPHISVQGDEVVIRVPRYLIDSKNGEQIQEKAVEKKPVDFRSLIGMFKDIPEFKGKTSVEVQHMITDLWAKKTQDYSS